MAEPSLYRESVFAFAGEPIATGMAEHVGVDGKAEAGRLAGPLDEPLKSLTRHRAAALADKNIPVLPGLAIKPPQGACCQSDIGADTSRSLEACRIVDR